METSKYYDLIPELKEWGDVNGHPYEPEDWLCGIGTFEHAIAYSTIFWPEFVEYDGCIIVGGAPDPDNYQSWLRSTNGEKHRVEAVLNHLHLVDLFSVAKATSQQLEYLGSKIQRKWLLKAQAEFPSRNIVVDFYRGNEEDLVEYQVTLFQTP